VVQRSGVADLPLHGGHVPAWLTERMTKLGTAIAENIVFYYGASGLLSRLSDPFWFQALGSVTGMDWHSSGITTSVLGALKRGINPRATELGIYVCGGRGKHSRKTPDELRSFAESANLPGDSLVRSSRLTAKIDNNAIADGFQLYVRARISRLRFSSFAGESRAANASVAGSHRGSGAWSPDPLRRSGSLFLRIRGQRRTSLSGPAQDL
jgi:hypothetical protein